MEPFDQLRSAACLAHALPGVTLSVTTEGGAFTVGRHRLDAALDPCAFRIAIARAGDSGDLHGFIEVITGCEVVGGALDLGGGLHQPTHPGSLLQRWFTTLLPADRVRHLATECPLPVPAGSVTVVAHADGDLGVCAVEMAVGPGGSVRRLDEAAFWLLSACVAEELVATIEAEIRP